VKGGGNGEGNEPVGGAHRDGLMGLTCVCYVCDMCVCVYARAHARACVCVFWERVGGGGGGGVGLWWGGGGWEVGG